MISRRLVLGSLLLISTGLGCGGRGGTSTSVAEKTRTRVKLSVTAVPLENPEDIFAVRVSFENPDRDDFLIDLGLIHAGGRCLHPDALKLVLTDSKGRSRELRFIKSPGHTDPAGRAEPYIVPLRAASSYSLNLNLRQYQPVDRAGSGLRLNAGKYRLRAEYDGASLSDAAADVWKGRLRSNEITFNIR